MANTTPATDIGAKLNEAITKVFTDSFGDMTDRANFRKNFGEFVAAIDKITQQFDRNTKSAVEKLATDQRPNVNEVFFRIPRGWSDKTPATKSAPEIKLNL